MRTAHDSRAVAYLLRELEWALAHERTVGWYAERIIATREPDLLDFALYWQGWDHGNRRGRERERDRLLLRGGVLHDEPSTGRQAKRKRERKARRKARAR